MSYSSSSVDEKLRKLTDLTSQIRSKWIAIVKCLLHKLKIIYNRNDSTDETSASLTLKEDVDYTLEKGIWKQIHNSNLAVHVHSHARACRCSHAVLVRLLSQLLFTCHTVYAESESTIQSVLLQSLYAELESKKMIFFKHQLHVSDIVGQGEVYKTNFVQ